jgi:enoyl-CoA hydratase
MDDILFERRGRLALVTLNREKALNALTLGMVRALHRQLDAWAADDGVAIVAIRGAGEKAFCAGGDIRALYEAGRPGGDRGRANFEFYHDEYLMNAAIKRYPKPYVALMDGVVMGGGVGVSIHGSLRIATGRTVFAMPETGIGLFPDVGGTFFLPRLPGETGMWLGLTGARLKGADTVTAGVCDRLVEPAEIDRLIESMAEGELPEGGPGTGALPEQARIDRAFAGESVEAVLEALGGEGDWGAAQAGAIRGKSPASTRLAFRQIREGARLSFEECMRLEYRLARFCMTHGDFYEGVRTTLIDKDEAPLWDPPTLAEADDALVAPAFAPLGEEELPL